MGKVVMTDEHHAATAADILARGPKMPSIEPRWQKYFDRLNRLREYIAQQRSSQMVDAHAEEPVFGANPADRGTDEYDMGVALSLISSEQNALFEIDQALRRIRDGTYGRMEFVKRRENRFQRNGWMQFRGRVSRATLKKSWNGKSGLESRDTFSEQFRCNLRQTRIGGSVVWANIKAWNKGARGISRTVRNRQPCASILPGFPYSEFSWRFFWSGF
jgi:hypothetical protein